MEKILKYLMLMLVATLSLTFTACGGDDPDEPESSQGSSNVKEQTVSIANGPAFVKLDDEETLAFQNDIQRRETILLQGDADRLAFVPDATSLYSITKIPSSSWSTSRSLSNHFIDGGYVAEYTSKGGNLIYLKIWLTFNRNASGEFSAVNVKWTYLN